MYTECILYYAKSINKINYFLAIIQAFNQFLVGLFWESGIWGDHWRGFGLLEETIILSKGYFKVNYQSI